MLDLRLLTSAKILAGYDFLFLEKLYFMHVAERHPKLLQLKMPQKHPVLGYVGHFLGLDCGGVRYVWGKYGESVPFCPGLWAAITLY